VVESDDGDGSGGAWSAGTRRVGAPLPAAVKGVVSDLEAMMGRERTHRAVSSDGTEIVAHVHGRGQPLVLVSGSGDGQNDPFLLSELSESNT